MWALDNVGKINSDKTRYFYLKDHLGSIRAVVDVTNSVVSAQDYDMWGHIMENRTFSDSRVTYNKTYEFTGKERDDESSYDYFGARYYDSRIGRWGGVEPLMEKYFSWSPYNYVFSNPLKNADLDGKDAKVTIEGNVINVDVAIYYELEGANVLNSEQLNTLNEYVTEANREWNEVGKEFIYEGRNFERKFEVVFNIHAEPVKNVEMLPDIGSGSNIALPSEEQGLIGFLKEGNQFIIGKNEGYKPVAGHSPAHEAGHAIGLPHPKDKQAKGTVMSYRKDRPGPTEQDLRIFINTLDLSKKFQIVKTSK